MWTDSRHRTSADGAKAPSQRCHKISMGNTCRLFSDHFYERQMGRMRGAAYWWNLKESIKPPWVRVCACKDTYMELLLVHSKCALIMMEQRKDQYSSLMSQKKHHAQRISKMEKLMSLIGKACRRLCSHINFPISFLLISPFNCAWRNLFNLVSA